ncbi:hypothetical protein DFH11DRAFT_1883474 [Phellopilus nigrolimitatus]|nr:hypothetical protein DFH11DRAFT_1883474 [Phellopilus nigrolimitatus]
MEVDLPSLAPPQHVHTHAASPPYTHIHVSHPLSVHPTDVRPPPSRLDQNVNDDLAVRASPGAPSAIDATPRTRTNTLTLSTFNTTREHHLHHGHAHGQEEFTPRSSWRGTHARAPANACRDAHRRRRRECGSSAELACSRCRGRIEPRVSRSSDARCPSIALLPPRLHRPRRAPPRARRTGTIMTTITITTLLAYLSEYPHVRQAFYKPRLSFHPATATGGAWTRTGATTSAHSAATASADLKKDGFFKALTGRGKEKKKAIAITSGLNPSSPTSPSSSASPRMTNMLSLVERFTFRPSPTESSLPTPPPFLPPEIQYWAAVIMRNACRKDKSLQANLPTLTVQDDGLRMSFLAHSYDVPIVLFLLGKSSCSGRPILRAIHSRALRSASASSSVSFSLSRSLSPLPSRGDDYSFLSTTPQGPYGSASDVALEYYSPDVFHNVLSADGVVEEMNYGYAVAEDARDARTAYASKTLHICARCGRSFNRPSSLKLHEHTHTGAKPLTGYTLSSIPPAFVCPFPECGRSFSVASNMRRHHRTHGKSSKSKGSPKDLFAFDQLTARPEVRQYAKEYPHAPYELSHNPYGHGGRPHDPLYPPSPYSHAGAQSYQWWHPQMFPPTPPYTSAGEEEGAHAFAYGPEAIIPRMDTVMALGKEKGRTSNDASGLAVPVDPALDERPSSRPNSAGSDDESSAPEDDSASSYHASSPDSEDSEAEDEPPAPSENDDDELPSWTTMHDPYLLPGAPTQQPSPNTPSTRAVCPLPSPPDPLPRAHEVPGGARRCSKASGSAQSGPQVPTSNFTYRLAPGAAPPPPYAMYTYSPPMPVEDAEDGRVVDDDPDADGDPASARGPVSFRTKAGAKAGPKVGAKAIPKASARSGAKTGTKARAPASKPTAKRRKRG